MEAAVAAVVATVTQTLCIIHFCCVFFYHFFPIHLLDLVVWQTCFLFIHTPFHNRKIFFSMRIDSNKKSKNYVYNENQQITKIHIFFRNANQREMHTHTHDVLNIYYGCESLWRKRHNQWIGEWRKKASKIRTWFAFKSSDAAAVLMRMRKCVARIVNSIMSILLLLLFFHIWCALFESFSVFNFHLQIFLCCCVFFVKL